MYLGLAKDVVKISEALGFQYKMASSNFTNRLHSEIEDLYSVYSGASPLWNRLHDCYSIQNPLGWTLLDDFICNRQFILFFDLDDDPNSLIFDKETSIVTVLKECTQFVFYVTDLEHNYLLCFNDHDFLIGCGNAMSWVENLSNETGL